MLKPFWTAVAVFMLMACNTTPRLIPPSPATPKTNPAILPAHLVELQFQDVGSVHPTSQAAWIGAGVQKQSLTSVTSGLSMQHLSTNTFTVRSKGTRYLSVVYRVTNKTGRTLHNLTFVGANLDDADSDPTNNTVQPTPGDTILRSVRYFDGSDASQKAATLVPGPMYGYDFQNDNARVIPEGTRFSRTVDTSEFFPEAPAGLVLESKPMAWVLDGEFHDQESRLLTFSVSYPMAATSAQDPFGFSVLMSMVEDLSLGEPFNISLKYAQTAVLTDSQKRFFDAAARRWEKVIKDGVQDFIDWDIGTRVLNVDDLEIQVDVKNMDGVGGVLGRAGPEYVRPQSEIPITGIMQFDVADLAQLEAAGTLENTIMHEMGHVLGIGTIYPWEQKLTHNGGSSCQNATSVLFSGPLAMQQHQLLGGTGKVPVEDQGGPGTKCGHWKEAVFDHELMTGYIEAGSMPLSALTVGALHDLGYGVNMQAAEPYQRPAFIRQGVPASGHELLEELLRPVPLPPRQ